MKKILLSILLSTLSTLQLFSQVNTDSSQINIDIIEKSLDYQTGIIKFKTGNATLKIPKGFRFLDKKQSNFVLTELWGNPLDSSILGMLVPANKGVLDSKSWVFSISYDNMGYVEDKDAEDIDYDELLTEQQNEFKNENPERVKSGYPTIEFIGWASKPFYDNDKKILHWAKELKFGTDSSVNTLNYNLRILGSKGLFMFNAIATMNELPEVKANLNNIINSIEFDNGSKYSDFDPENDHIAEWTIGSLVAGKILAKVGFFALFIKFWKFLAFGIIAGFGAIWNFFKKKKNEETIQNSEVTENTTEALQDEESQK